MHTPSDSCSRTTEPGKKEEVLCALVVKMELLIISQCHRGMYIYIECTYPLRGVTGSSELLTKSNG